MIIGVLGCMAQSLKHDILENKPYVDIVLGPDSYRKLPEILNRHEQDEGNVVDTQLSRYEVYDDLFPSRKNGVNAWVTIKEDVTNFAHFALFLSPGVGSVVEVLRASSAKLKKL